MEELDLKKEAYRNIDSLEGDTIGMVQIMLDSKGHMSTCIGGVTDIIIDILAQAMKDSDQFKNLFESAYCQVSNIGFNSNLN